jgi:DNA-binding MarR family transcriptional regulator
VVSHEESFVGSLIINRQQVNDYVRYDTRETVIVKWLTINGGGHRVGDVSNSRVLLPELGVLPGHLFWRAQSRVASALSEVLPPGVDIHAYAALLALSGGVTRSQQALAEAVSVSRTTMVRVANDLSEQGLVKRVRNPDDRRSYALTRTPEGAAAARRWRRHAEDLEDSITSGFTLEEREELRDLLLQVARADLAPDVPEPLRDSIGFLVTRVHSRMHREFMVALEPLRIEPRDFGVLTALRVLGPVSQAELARAFGVSGASVVQIVDDLEGRGLVERQRPATDRRTQVLHLQPEVPEVLAEASRLAHELTQLRLGALSKARTKRLVLLMQRLVTAP